jgi:hypothetical protein
MNTFRLGCRTRQTAKKRVPGLFAERGTLAGTKNQNYCLAIEFVAAIKGDSDLTKKRYNSLRRGGRCNAFLLVTASRPKDASFQIQDKTQRELIASELTLGCRFSFFTSPESLKKVLACFSKRQQVSIASLR